MAEAKRMCRWTSSGTRGKQIKTQNSAPDYSSTENGQPGQSSDPHVDAGDAPSSASASASALASGFGQSLLAIIKRSKTSSSNKPSHDDDQDHLVPTTLHFDTPTTLSTPVIADEDDADEPFQDQSIFTNTTAPTAGTSRSASKWKCPECKKLIADSTFHIRRHQETHQKKADKQQFRCFECGHLRTRWDNFRQHCRDKHKHLLEDSKNPQDYEDLLLPSGVQFNCFWCGYESNVRQKLYEHTKEKHPGHPFEYDEAGALFKCFYCSFMFEKGEQLKVHLSSNPGHHRFTFHRIRR